MESDATKGVDEAIANEFWGTSVRNHRPTILTMESMQAAYDQCTISPDRAYANVTIPTNRIQTEQDIMTKRHFEMIARILCKHYNRDMGTMEQLVGAFCNELVNWNPSFDPNMFAKACLTETSESQ